jgi:hypothetical protein
MSCHKKTQATPSEEIVQHVSPLENSKPVAKAEDATTTLESPDVALTPNKPEYDKAPPPTAPPKVVAPPVVKKTEEPQKVTTPKKTAVATPQVPVKKNPPTAAPVVMKKEEPGSASNFIIAAYKTMVSEGKKIGAACNFYLGRVLEVLGFKTVDFLANDFDVAAKKMFKSYKVFKFTTATELKRHLWSYRERTGFIFQWERVGAPGHVAIIERVGETLYIYQASLNKYTARVEKTTLERLLQVNSHKGVRVYSDFQK